MNKVFVTVFAITMLYPLPGVALTTDRDQPMLIEADQAELDDSNGISIYRGDIQVTQGTLKLTGDVMTVHAKDGRIEKVVVNGSPATYQQRPDGKEEDVFAQSLQMEYYAIPERMILLKNAEVTQGGDVLRSERIVYDVTKDQVNAGSINPNSDGERVRITIQPKPKTFLDPDSSE